MEERKSVEMKTTFEELTRIPARLVYFCKQFFNEIRQDGKNVDI